MPKSSNSKGNWVTINGTHVLIGKDGTISKGPSHMVGKKPSEVGSSSRRVSASARGNSEYRRQVRETGWGGKTSSSRKTSSGKTSSSSSKTSSSTSRSSSSSREELPPPTGRELIFDDFAYTQASTAEAARRFATYRANANGVSSSRSRRINRGNRRR